MKLDLAALDPAPDKVVANLPYGVAATVLLKSIAELPRARRSGWRWSSARWPSGSPRRPAARATARPRCSPSSPCEVRVLRRVPRTVFHPAPNVESALVVLRRTRARAARRSSRALVHAGFAHRRKALAGSLALAPGAPAGHPRRARAPRSSSIGHPADARAERLAPGGLAAAGGARSARERLDGACGRRA